MTNSDKLIIKQNGKANKLYVDVTKSNKKITIKETVSNILEKKSFGDVVLDEKDALKKINIKGLDEEDIEKYNKLSAEKIQSMIADEQLLLTITSDGMGKRSSAYEYRITGRGGKGISNINLQDKASVVMTSVADNEKEIIMITNKGQTTRIKASEIRLIGRNTKGVKVFDLKDGEYITSITIV